MICIYSEKCKFPFNLILVYVNQHDKLFGKHANLEAGLCILGAAGTYWSISSLFDRTLKGYSDGSLRCTLPMEVYFFQYRIALWRHGMGVLSELLALCAVTDAFSHKGPVMHVLHFYLLQCSGLEIIFNLILHLIHKSQALIDRLKVYMVNCLMAV